MLSADCTPCPGGRYCETPGLTQPTGDCQPGFYCSQGANNSSPTDGITGDVCPQGKYCEAGSAVGEKKIWSNMTNIKLSVIRMKKPKIVSFDIYLIKNAKNYENTYFYFKFY